MILGKLLQEHPSHTRHTGWFNTPSRQHVTGQRQNIRIDGISGVVAEKLMLLRHHLADRVREKRAVNAVGDTPYYGGQINTKRAPA